MLLSTLRERSLCLLNSENLDSTFQPWLTISDAKFHPDVWYVEFMVINYLFCSFYLNSSALYCNENINPIQSIQINYLPPLISYLWPLVHQGANVWTVDHLKVQSTTPIKFVLKYDLLIWELFYNAPDVRSSLSSNTIYPRVLILVPDWLTCENTYKHLSSTSTDTLKRIVIHYIYEGQNIEGELYRKLLKENCDLLIATPTIVNDLIQKRYIHFERLQMIVVSLECVTLLSISPKNGNHST